MKRVARIAVAEMLLLAAVDQLTKWLVLNDLDIGPGGSVPVTSFFSIVHWWNKGVSFGVFNGLNAPEAQQAILIVLTFLIISVLVFSMKRAERPFVVYALAMIVGGALGNLVDRVHYGMVADFLYFHWRKYDFPAFNFADSCVTVGVALLLLDGSGVRFRKEKSASFMEPVE